MYFYTWADTSSRQASVVVHTIFMAQEVAEDLKKHTHTHTQADVPTHSLKRAVAKGRSFHSMKKMLQDFQLKSPHTSISLKRIPTNFNRSIQVMCK